MKEDTIVRNALQTPDGTTLESHHRHDYQEHTDANGEEYIVDGGLDYIRSTCHKDQVSLVVTYGEGHEKVRNATTWGTYGKSGTEPLQYKRISDMSTNHLEAVLANVRNIRPVISQVMRDELVYRKEHEDIS